MILGKLTAVLLSSALLTSCASLEATTAESEQVQQSPACTTHTVTYKDDDTASDWQSAAYTSIILNGDTVSINGSGASAASGDITISQAGTYVLSGTLTDGTLTVDAGKEDIVTIVLNGAALHCSDSAPFYAKQVDKTILILADGTQNTLTDGEAYLYPDDTTDEPNAALFSKDDLTITGSGSLTVNARYNNGIGSKDDLKITGGTLSVTAADDALVGKDSVGISGGTILLNAQGDGIKSSNDTDAEKGFIRISGGSLSITAAGDGMQAVTCIHYDGGDATINAGGGSAAAASRQTQGFGRQQVSETETSDTPSTKGVKSDHQITISGGTLTIDSQDDAVHTNDAIFITGGSITAATGDDGIHADNSLSISGGMISIPTSYEGLEASVIDISSGDISLNASDDGINAAGGEDEELMTSQAQNGQTPQEPPTGNEGERPQPPSGQMNGQNAASQTGLDRQSGAPTGTPPEGMGGGRGQGSGMPPGGMGQNTSSNSLTISGGTIYVNADGDGIDTNGSVSMTGGTVMIDGPENSGNSALDYDGAFLISGGTLIAAGSSGMMQTPSDTSTQSSVVMTFSAAQAAGTTFRLLDSNGNELTQYTPAKRYQSLILSTPALQKGSSYSADINGTSSVSFTLENAITYLTESGVSDSVPRGGMMGSGSGGGRMGGRGSVPNDTFDPSSEGQRGGNKTSPAQNSSDQQ